MKLLSRVWLFATPWTVAYQAPPSMEFSRQEYWSGLPFPSISFPRGSSQPRDQTQVCHIIGRHFNVWATREVQIYIYSLSIYIERREGKSLSLYIYIERERVIFHNSVSNNHLWHNCYHGRVTKISEQQIWKGWEEFPQLIQEPLLSMADRQCQK